MTESESNSLRRELAALAPMGDHPEADVLTAFAEGSLLKSERHAVLRHLAGCLVCREALNLCAIEEREPAREFEFVAAARVPLAAERKAHSSTRTWMPWAAVAAGIVIACGVALHYEEKRLAQGNSIAKQETPPSTTSSSDQQRPRSAISTGAVPRENAGGSVPRQPRPLSETQASQLQPLARPVTGKTFSNQSSEIRAEQSTDLRVAAPAPNASAFGDTVTANASDSSPAATLARAHWRINDKGQPERSFGDGAWQLVLPGDESRMYVLSVANGEVWVGGENQRVYKSRDAGENWQAIILPPKGASPHTIVHIRFEAPRAGTIEAADGTTWATEDGGDTWN